MKIGIWPRNIIKFIYIKYEGAYDNMTMLHVIYVKCF